MPRIMGIEGNTISLLITIGLLLLLLIPSSGMVIPNTILDKAVIAYGQANKINSNLTNLIVFQNVLPKKIHVGDIDIAYKMFGKGEVLLLIPGSSMTMDEWEPNVLNKLASNHTVVIFDNRGIGKTTAGNKTWSIEQFANDTAGLLDALKIEKPVDVLGFSLGGSIAQELTLMHPQKVNKLILYATNCGGKTTLPPQLSPSAMKSMMSGNASKYTFLSALFPKEWIKANAAYVQKFISLMTLPPMGSIQHQAEVSLNWKGACDILPSITKPTLIITGTDDVTSPPANSLVLAEKIPGAWLVQIKGGGHGAIFQYPDKFSRIILTFLET
jgi:pimeloyl-ACP methyl ester carboxylesterase